MAAIWLNVDDCTGCGACVEVCPTGALTLIADKAHLDVTLCRDCQACLQACPAGALRPVLAIEAVPAPQTPDVRVTRAIASPQPAPWKAIIAAGAELLVQAAPIIVQSVSRLLLRSRSASAGRSLTLTSTNRLLDSGRQTRRRQRGRW